MSQVDRTSLEPLLEEVVKMTNFTIEELRKKKLAEDDMEILLAMLNITIQKHLLATADEYETVAMVSKVALFACKLCYLVKEEQTLCDQRH
tara:strand:+ start:1817 stop:2089 length:273 start_codon:yes stop_codon:yes gene_type:complete